MEMLKNLSKISIDKPKQNHYTNKGKILENVTCIKESKS